MNTEQDYIDNDTICEARGRALEDSILAHRDLIEEGENETVEQLADRIIQLAQRFEEYIITGK